MRTLPRILSVVLLLLFLAGATLGHIEAAQGRGRPEPTSRSTKLGKGMPDRQRGEIPGTTGSVHGPTRGGSAVYPEQDLPIRFNHGQHLALGLDCRRCHQNIADSRSAADVNFPKGAACDGCHGQQHPRPRGEPAQCTLCHTRTDTSGERVTATIRAPKPLLTFNHALHEKAGAPCRTCHGDMSKVRLATALQLPAEATCLDCHDGFGATNRCGACHPSGSDGRLSLRAQDDRTLPALVPRGRSSWGAEHDLAFVEDHAGISKSNPRLCETCHDETFCTDCHAGSIRPLRIHAGDYLTTHAMDARARSMDCQACHRTQTFCQGCHDRVGFGDRKQGAFGVGGPLQFHPSGWSGPPGSPQGHAHAAQRNIGACASCHDEDSCLACHATTDVATPGLGANPHGAGFGTSPRCQALASRNRRVCLKCHAPGDPNLECM